MEEKKKSMTKDEMIMELMELLKANGRPKQAADVFESAAYVDMLESKLDQMTNELVQMRKELQEIIQKWVCLSICSLVILCIGVLILLFRKREEKIDKKELLCQNGDSLWLKI